MFNLKLPEIFASSVNLIAKPVMYCYNVLNALEN